MSDLPGTFDFQHSLSLSRTITIVMFFGKVMKIYHQKNYISTIGINHVIETSENKKCDILEAFLKQRS